MAGDRKEVDCRRLAAVDVGSNTVHSLVADACQGRLEDVAHYVEMPELGTVVARSGRIGEAKTEEAIAALRSVLERARRHGYEHLLAGATAAVRKAADRDQFLARASAAIGAPVRLISERREAELSFRGVARRHASRRPRLVGGMGGAGGWGGGGGGGGARVPGRAQPPRQPAALADGRHGGRQHRAGARRGRG